MQTQSCEFATHRGATAGCPCPNRKGTHSPESRSARRWACVSRPLPMQRTRVRSLLRKIPHATGQPRLRTTAPEATSLEPELHQQDTPLQGEARAPREGQPPVTQPEKACSNRGPAQPKISPSFRTLKKEKRSNLGQGPGSWLH